MLFPEFDVREIAFVLAYKKHGGSGLNVNYETVMDMEFSEIQWLLDRLNDEREREAGRYGNTLGAGGELYSKA